jgi:hypothetical protein
MRNGSFEKFTDDPMMGNELLEEYRRTQDIAVKIVAEQVLNVFADEEIARLCLAGMSKDYPAEKFSVVELHLVTSSREWS